MNHDLLFSPLTKFPVFVNGTTFHQQFQPGSWKSPSILLHALPSLSSCSESCSFHPLNMSWVYFHLFISFSVCASVIASHILFILQFSFPLMSFPASSHPSPYHAHLLRQLSSCLPHKTFLDLFSWWFKCSWSVLYISSVNHLLTSFHGGLNAPDLCLHIQCKPSLLAL